MNDINDNDNKEDDIRRKMDITYEETVAELLKIAPNKGYNPEIFIQNDTIKKLYTCQQCHGIAVNAVSLDCCIDDNYNDADGKVDIDDDEEERPKSYCKDCVESLNVCPKCGKVIETSPMREGRVYINNQLIKCPFNTFTSNSSSSSNQTQTQQQAINLCANEDIKISSIMQHSIKNHKDLLMEKTILKLLQQNESYKKKLEKMETTIKSLQSKSKEN